MKTLSVLTNILQAFSQAIYITDNNRKILFFNNEAEKITGFMSQELVGKNCHDDILNHIDEHGVKLCIGPCPLLNTLMSNTVTYQDAFLQHKEGYRIPVSIKTIPVVEEDVVVGAVEVFEILTKRAPHLDEYVIKDNLMIRDPLTKLLNRNFLKYKLENKLSLNIDHNHAFLFMDIDDFKFVNDTHGHLIGDKVLRVISKTLLANTSSKDYVIRFGGEEFLIVLKVDNIELASHMADILRIVISNSYVDVIDYFPKVSIGVTMFNRAESIDDAIHKADKAMYVAKKNGKNRTVISNRF